METRSPSGENPLKNNSNATSKQDASRGLLAMLWTTDITEIEKEIGSTIIQGATDAAAQQGFDVRSAPLAPEGPLPDFILNGEVDGILVQGSVPSDAVVEQLKHLPVVWLLTKGQNNWSDRVQPDNYEVGRASCEHFITHGHQQIACVTSAHSTDTPAYYERAAAFASCANQHGIPVHFLDETSEHGLAPEERRAKLADRLLALQPSLTALFIANDNVVSLIGELTDRGIHIGKDLLVICSNREYAQICSADLRMLIVDIHAEIIGREAVAQVLWRISHRDVSEPVCKRIPPQLIDSKELR